MNTMQIDVVSAEESIFSGETTFVVVPGVAGDLGIYPKHAPLITKINPGPVKIAIKDSDEEKIIFVSGGLLEVQPTVVTVLADTAIRAKDLDEAKAIEAKNLAEETLRNAESKKEIATVEAELAVLNAQLATIQKIRRQS